MLSSLLGVIAALVLGPEPAQQQPIRTEVVVDAPLEEVWAAWSTKSGLESWLAPSAEVELRLGGRYSTNITGRVGEPGTLDLTILAFEPLHALCITKAAPPDAFPTVAASNALWAVITLRPVDAGRTLVQQSTLGWQQGEEWERARLFFRQADRYVLESLRRRFEDRHAPLIPRVYTSRTLSRQVEVAAPVEIAWQVLTTPAGLASWLGAHPSVDLSPGGSITYSTSPGAEPIVERILAFDPERVLATRYDLPEGLESVLGVVEQTWTMTRLEPTDSGGTRITRTMLGWESGQAWDEAYRFFDAQMGQQMRALARRLGKPAENPEPTGTAASAVDDDRPADPEPQSQPGKFVFERLAGLVGNWSAVLDRQQEGRVLVRTSFRLGPDGQSIVCSTHIADRERDAEQSTGLIWLDPETRQAAFVLIDNLGQVTRGSFAPAGDELIGDCRVSTDSSVDHMDVRLIPAEDGGHVRLVIRESGASRPMIDIEFSREDGGSGE
ncbi:MAG: hypothetical protein Kow0022_11130 [Phycisphaerales bacterium]